jgi:hypothetical protein
VERKTICESEWKYKIIDWAAGINLEAGSFIMFVNKRNSANKFQILQTREVLDLSVTHMSHSLLKTFDGGLVKARETLQQAVEQTKNRSTFFCPHQQKDALVFIPLVLNSYRDASREGKANFREIMVSAAMAELGRCFRHVVAVLSSQDEAESRARISALKLPVTDVVVAEVGPELDGNVLPLKSVYLMADLLQKGRWPDAKYILFTEDDQLPLMRVSAAVLFKGAKEQGYTGPLIFTPHRLNLMREEHRRKLPAGVTGRTITDLRNDSGWCASAEIIRMLEEAQNDEDCAAVPKVSYQNANATGWGHIWWMRGLPHYASMGNHGNSNAVPGNQAQIAHSGSCSAEQPSGAAVG